MSASVICNCICPNLAYAASSDSPSSGDITITNNVGKTDTVNVNNLSVGDTVKVYTAASGGKAIGSAKVSSNRSDVTVIISQLGKSDGTVYVTVTSVGESESSRTPADYDAEPISDSPMVDNIIVTNNVGKSDTVYATGLSAGDTIKVYNAPSSGKLMGSAKVASNKDSVTATISSLGSTGGSVYVTITSIGQNESGRTEVEYLPEAKSDGPDADNISFTNNSGKADTVYVSGLAPGDTVKVYNAGSGGRLLGSAKVSGSNTDVTVTVTQLGIAAGNVYVSVTSVGENESERVPAGYPGESQSDKPITENIVVTNNAGIPDTVKVSGLLAGDVVKVYNSSKGQGGSMLKSASAASDGTSVTLSISQLGSTKGSVFVTVTSANKLESERVEADYSDELQSDNPDPDNITVTNNPTGTADTIAATNLSAGDVIKVYSADIGNGGKTLGSGTVPSGSTKVTISLTQLGTSAGSVYISLTNKGKLESGRIEVGYLAEAKSVAPDSNKIIISNNVGKADVVDVTNLSAADVVKVYNADKSGNLLGSATVASGKSEVKISINSLVVQRGSVYVSVTSKGKLESARTKGQYSAELKSNNVDIGNITITNNPVGTPDTIQAAGLLAGDVVKVYNLGNGGNLLGSATVPANSSAATVSIPQLGSTGGSVYISITSTNELESDRVPAIYSGEVKSDAPKDSDIVVTNNANASDTIEVNGLSYSDSDVAKVYDSYQGGTLLGSAAVTANSTYATITVPQLGSAGGSVYVSVTSKGKLESIRTEAKYSAELISEFPLLLQK